MLIFNIDMNETVVCYNHNVLLSQEVDWKLKNPHVSHVFLQQSIKNITKTTKSKHQINKYSILYQLTTHKYQLTTTKLIHCRKIDIDW